MLTISKIYNCLIVIILAAVPLNIFAAESGSYMESRLQVLEDREEIRALLNEYGRTLDARDFKSFSELFAKDIGE